MARDKLRIFNEAIGDVPGAPIDGVEDTRKEGRECRRFYDGVIEDLLGVHDWSWARRRVLLAEVTNDRTGEWAYAYALPIDNASPIVLIPNYEEAGALPGYVTTPLVYSYGAYSDLQSAYHSQIRFVVSGTTLYTDMNEAILEYVTADVDVANFPSLFSQAVIRLLAMRIYKPILGSEADPRELQMKFTAAEFAKKEAVADDLNRQPNKTKFFVSDGEMARLGTAGHYRGRS
jgi:hypothetical protein